jgi:hypothetical protein
LIDVFRDYGEVYLEVQIGADGAPGTEVLTPRTRVFSTAYALNASNLAGEPITNLLRSDESDAYTSGTLTFNPPTTLDVDGALNMDGAVTKATTDHVANFNADLLDGNDSSAFAAAAHGHTGGEITGPVAEADTLDGLDSTDFLNTSSAAQSKLGPLTVDAGAVPGATGITAVGEFYGGQFSVTGGNGWANVALGNSGIDARGTHTGAYFADSDSSGNAHVGYGDYGISANGYTVGGYFEDSNSSGRSWVGYGDIGIDARGNGGGGYFADSDGTGWAYVGYLDEGISAHGTVQGGFFQDDDSTGQAHVAYGDRGIEASGSETGGYFEDSDNSGYAWVGYGDQGILAYGNTYGGYFRDADSTGYARVGYGDYGIQAFGSIMGGHFEDSNGSGYARAGYGDYGIQGYGNLAGGRFEDTDSSSYAYAGYGGEGIYAYGSARGGYFGSGSAMTSIAVDDTGIRAHGNLRGGQFWDSDQSGYAAIASGDTGIFADGSFSGGSFTDADGSGWSWVGFDVYKVYGSGEVSFVQNHPYESDRVIVYAAPEGDEVAVYTRGTARLSDGIARVPLGETFRWVANPDIGLTAHVTPRGQWADLYVESVSSEELVVMGSGGAVDAAFDYVVYGLRIGFEETAVVQEKQREAYIPSMKNQREMLAKRPDLRRFTALERFKGMESGVRGIEAAELDLSRAEALKDAIHEYDPETDPPVSELLGHEGEGRPEIVDEHPPGAPEQEGAGPEIGGAASGPSVIETAALGTTEAGDDRAEVPVSPEPTFPVSEPVEAGELLALDPERPGNLVRAEAAQDPGIVGIAAGASVEVDGELRVALVQVLYATVKADAGYGAIRPGDLLTSSFTPGHAMRATEIVPGTIIGKALEPLETGTGLIRVLVMPR